MRRRAGGRPAAVFIALVLTGIHLGGCTSPTVAPSLDDSPASEALLIVIETVPADEPLRGEDLYPLTTGQWVYQIVDDDRARGQVVHTISPTDRPNALVSLDKGEERTEFWGRSEAGNIVMPASIEHAKNALTVFDPPLPIAPPLLAPGEPFESSADMQVLDSRNPKRRRENGRGTRSLEYVDDQRIRTPIGEFTAKRVVVKFHADLRFADAVEDGTYWVVPGVGVVAQEHSEEIRVLGLVSERTGVRVVLIEKRSGN
ncbi:MAG: hypothetical protein JSV91_05205 [Phycisphaerales bacterium]|nr:MAG: hypothetical protein JSV91_05205 [Phycisphaerales bacterium]